MPLTLTVEQYHQMIADQILREGEPIELLDGLLVQKDRSKAGENLRTVGHHHAYAVGQLVGLNEMLRPRRVYLRTQNPITLPPNNEPEPDGAIVRGTPLEYRFRHPLPADILCVFEVADSSLTHDRTTKLRIYADAAIPQYVIVNLIERTIEVYREPKIGNGRYLENRVLKCGEAFAIENLTEFEIAVADLLP